MTAREVIAVALEGRMTVRMGGTPGHMALRQADAILAALAGAGFAVVPVEATAEMLQAAFAVEPQTLKQFRTRIDCWPSDIAAMHRAMVAAAQPAREGGE
jgi:hypothetical protein